MSDATSVKCPSCARPKDAACIRLVRTPDQRVVWASSEPHPARVAKTDG